MNLFTSFCKYQKAGKEKTFVFTTSDLKNARSDKIHLTKLLLE